MAKRPWTEDESDSDQLPCMKRHLVKPELKSKSLVLPRVTKEDSSSDDDTPLAARYRQAQSNNQNAIGVRPSSSTQNPNLVIAPLENTYMSKYDKARKSYENHRKTLKHNDFETAIKLADFAAEEWKKKEKECKDLRGSRTKANQKVQQKNEIIKDKDEAIKDKDKIIQKKVTKIQELKTENIKLQQRLENTRTSAQITKAVKIEQTGDLEQLRSENLALKAQNKELQTRMEKDADDFKSQKKALRSAIKALSSSEDAE